MHPAASSAPTDAAPTTPGDLDALRESILGPLDAGQRAAAEQVRGPVAILAGAGTGKTTTVTHRIAWQVASGAFDARELLAVTFTRKAAGELRTRLAALGVRGVEARTFHSAAGWMHGVLYERYRGTPVPRLMSSKAVLLRPLIRSLPAPHCFKPTADFASDIEWAKVNGITPAGFVAAAEREDRELELDAGRLAEMYEAYEERKARAGAWDFEDLLLELVRLFDDVPEAAERIRSRFRAFTVDEYQDVSPLQQALVERWLGDRDDICVVGDDQQTIYTFAGASAAHLLGFGREHPGAHVHALETSYRSTPEVLEHANAIGTLLQHEAGSTRRTLTSAGQDAGPPAELRVLSSEESETQAVVTWLRGHIDAGVEPGELAVLVRTNQLTEPFEEALAQAGMPYHVVGGSFLTRPGARQLLGELLRGGVADAALGDGELAQVVEQATAGLGWEPAGGASGSAGGGRAAKDEATRQDDLGRLVALARGAEAAATTSRRAWAADLEARFSSDADARGVQLLTMHRAKGLEYEGVALPRLTERTLPYHRSGSKPADEIEERRLFYVGLTRAKRHLLLTCAPAGKRGPSRFLAEAGFDVPAVKQPAGGSAGSSGGGASKSPARDQLDEGGQARFDALRAWRTEVAREIAKPAYTVFSDRTLAGIAATVPGSHDELAGISGVGPAKLERYADDVLAVLADHASAG